MGSAGCGRSHLLRALTARPDAVYIHAANGENMLRVLAGADSKSPMPKFVAVDDVHRMDDNRQAGLFALYNRWRESAATGRAFALAVAGDRALSMPLRGTCAPAWAGTGVPPGSAVRRRQAGRPVRPGGRARHAPAPEIINWMLTHHERDIRKLAALIDALDRYSLANGRPITLPLLRHARGPRLATQ